MSISTSNNANSLSLIRYADQAETQYQTSLERLASGIRLQSKEIEPSSLAQSGLLEARVRSYIQAESNVQQARSIVQLAEGSLNEIINLVTRLREVMLVAANDEIDPSVRDSLDVEYQSIIQEIDRLSQATRISGISLLNGEGKDLNIQVGPDNTDADRVHLNMSEINATSDSLDLTGISVYDSDGALDALDRIDEALNKVISMRSKVATYQSRLQSIGQSLASTREVTQGALSNLRDTDYASEIPRAISWQIQLKAALAVLAQANSSQSELLKLLQ